MPAGGLLSIEATTLGPAPDELDGGQYVRLRVADSGIGMDEITLKRATEPFFTTKGVGKGTGLGLSMVQGLAAQSGGAMRISSEKGQGTVIDLWLPQANEPATQLTPVTVPPTVVAPSAPLTILVVDDDALVATSTVAMLEDLGHHTIDASSGRKALEIVARNAAIDLVITDYAMPGMTGTELAREIGRLAPRLPVALATGYAELPQGEQLSVPRLPKPFTQADLSTLIRRLMPPAGLQCQGRRNPML